MAFRARIFDDLLQFASTSRSRSIVTLAAVSFALCHLLVVATNPAPGLQDDVPRELLHLAAELCRFVLPLGVMAFGMIQQLKRH